MDKNYYEVIRYNFNYDIQQNKIEYNLPEFKEILKKEQDFLNLRKIYKNTRYFRNYFNKFIEETTIIFSDGKKNDIYLTFNKPDDMNNHKLYHNAFILDFDKEGDEKYDLINATIFFYPDYKNLSIYEIIKYQYEPTIKKIKYMFNHLNDNGYFFFNVFQFDSKIIKLINLLLLIFERIFIYKARLTYRVYCFNYNPIIYKDTFLNLLENIEYIKIDSLINLEKLSNMIYKRLNFFNSIIDSIKNNDLIKYYSEVDKYHINAYINIQYANQNSPINPVLRDDIRNVLNINHLEIKDNYINSVVFPIEGNGIYNLIITNKLNYCLQIGMEFGIISFYILLGLDKLNNSDSKLVSIDEFQESRWHNFGLNLIKLNGFTKYHKLYLESSYLLLPKLLDIEINKYDLIFISGWHNFDYILLCILFASMLLKIDGYLVISNKYNNRVNKCLNYIDTNYNNFKKIESNSFLAIYKKTNEDKKEFNDYNNF